MHVTKKLHVQNGRMVMHQIEALKAQDENQP